MIFLFLAALAFAREPLWTYSFQDGKPTAVFFDVQTTSLFVSVNAGAQARVDQFSVDGKRLKKGVLQKKGVAGPLRTFAERLYWIVGQEVLRWSEEQGQEVIGVLPADLGQPTDLAVGSKERVFVGSSGGALYLLPEKKVVAPGAPITGLFLLVDRLFLLRGKDLESVRVASDFARKQEIKNFCGSCVGIERSSEGTWLTVDSEGIREVGVKGGTVFSPLPELAGRLAYLYRKDPKDDQVIVPLPKAGELRAFRKHGENPPAGK